MANTFAILFNGKGWEEQSLMYVTNLDLGRDIPHATGYGYCCGCKETIQFDTEIAAFAFRDRMKMPEASHRVIDSVEGKTLKKEHEKKLREKTDAEEEAALEAAMASFGERQAKHGSALTGKILKS